MWKQTCRKLHKGLVKVAKKAKVAHSWTSLTHLPVLRSVCGGYSTVPYLRHGQRAQQRKLWFHRKQQVNLKLSRASPPLTSEGPSVDPELQRTAEDHHCVAESSAQKGPSEISPCPRTEKEHDPEGSDCDEDSFEVITEARPEPAASEMGDGHHDTTAAVEAPGSAGAGSGTTETAPGTQVGQGKGHSAVDSRTTEEGQTASKTPKESDREPPLAQPALDALGKPPASNAVKHADKKFADGIPNDGCHLTTEATSSGKGHPATVVICDAEAEPLPDPEPLNDLDEAEERSFMKEMVETCSGLDAIELAEARVRLQSECPQNVHITCTEVTLVPVPRETRPVAAADVDTQSQGSSGTQKEPAHAQEGPAHAQKQEAKFSKSFYLCCSQCSDGEPSGEQ
ncbi:UNVERIFIED_CONTAM: hypothetical protein K2H54_016054 [Gekko kuhli]